MSFMFSSLSPLPSHLDDHMFCPKQPVRGGSLTQRHQGALLLRHLAAVVDRTDTHARGEDERATGCGSRPAVNSGLDLRREGCMRVR